MFFLILKITGIVLAVLLCLAAALLFLPVLYTASADTEDKKFSLHAGWLGPVITFDLKTEGGFSAVLRVLFYKKDFTKSKKKKRKKRKVKNKTTAGKCANTKPDAKKAKDEPDTAPQKVQRESIKGENLSPDGEAAGDFAEGSSKDAEGGMDTPGKKVFAPGDNAGDNGGANALTGKLSGAFKKIKEASPKAASTLKKAAAVLRSGVIGRLWPDTVRFLKRIKPSKLSGDVSFGFDDPSRTGMALGAAAMIVPLSQKDLHICPDFEAEKNYLTGNIKARGHIFLIHALIYIIVLVRDDEVRRLMGRS